MPETVPCKWCGTPTRMMGTKECDAHWELRHRIESEPAMAAEMLSKLAKYPNGAPMFAPDGMMLDDQGNRSIFDDVDQ